MSKFDEQAARLKAALGLQEDQEVAAALGMTKAAYSYRKRTQSFPEDRVIGLLAQHPGLNVGYVLHGIGLGELEQAKLAQLVDVADVAHPERLAWLVEEVRKLAVNAERKKDRPASLSLASHSATQPERGQGAPSGGVDPRVVLEIRLSQLLSLCSEDDLQLLLLIAGRLAAAQPPGKARIAVQGDQAPVADHSIPAKASASSRTRR